MNEQKDYSPEEIAKRLQFISEELDALTLMIPDDDMEHAFVFARRLVKDGHSGAEVTMRGAEQILARLIGACMNSLVDEHG